jgi:hypothetical protein
MTEALGANAAGFVESSELSEDADNIGNVAESRDEMQDLPDLADSEPAMVVDTTAELLGRAKAKRPRTRPTVAAASSRRTAAKRSPGTRRGSRSRKPAGD